MFIWYWCPINSYYYYYLCPRANSEENKLLCQRNEKIQTLKVLCLGIKTNRVLPAVE